MTCLLSLVFRSALAALAICITAQAQATEPAPPTQPAAREDKPPVEILSFKIGTDYYPMLDQKPSTMTADNPDFPRPESEGMSKRPRSARNEDIRSRGKLRSQIKVISDAQWVNVVIKNTGTKAIKAVEWDFAFPRYEEGRLALRYDVTSKVEIKAGGKKTLKQQLPPGATRCQAIIVSADAGRDEKAKTSEAVCGPGFLDPSKLKQETVTIKRIEYADDSVWQRR
ncbi:MAG TPA: hypothetical protein VFD58_31010 [Blastocatellia bacterium]|nr:hypothetical protein [Blastocatellia bacterium]